MRSDSIKGKKDSLAIVKLGISSTERYLHLTEVQAKAVNEMGLLLDGITP